MALRSWLGAVPTAGRRRERHVRVVVFGATGRIGRHVVEQALAADHEVIAFVRDPGRLAASHDRLHIIQGDAQQADRVAEAIAGSDAVIAALGPRGNTPDQIEVLATGMRNILTGMEAHGVRRLVALSGAGITARGEQKRGFDAAVSRVVRLLSRHVVGAKQREYEIFSATDLDWVAARPPFVREGPLTGRYRAGHLELGPGSRISRADLAHFMVRQLTDDTYLRSAPFVTY